LKIGLVGPSYAQTSLPFDAQRTINLYPVLDEYGKETASLYGTPGLSLFATAGNNPNRGMFRSANGRVFAVNGSDLYEINANGTTTSLGTFLTSSGSVSIAEGLTQLAVCDGVNVYELVYATDVFTKVNDPDLPSAGFITNIDGYFIVAENNTGRFYISAINNLTSWDALDFATAESDPDILISAVNAAGQLWLLGNKTTEIWTNTGSSAFPFARISGAVMQTGLIAKHSAIELDNSIFWVGKDRFGEGVVYRANGFTPQRVSTTPIEKRIQESNDKENIVAFAYQEQGHLFYVLTGGGLETSLVLDLTTNLWHERAFLNQFGNFDQCLANSHVYAFNRHLVGDRLSGNIYEMALGIYTDNGSIIARERVYTHISEEDRRIRFNKLDIGFETGVGLQSGQGSDPVCTLEVSKDGARTWSDPQEKPIGKVGEYQKKVSFKRLGVAEQMTFRLRIAEPVKVAITGSYLS
jgi:hypothetical protein